jgi:4-hydroxy-2-oxoglutarate aldolase
MKLSGIFVPFATPFDHTGALYRAKVEHNLDKLNHVKLSGYILGSHWGEGLSFDEKRQLWEFAAKWAAPDRIRIADVSSEGVELSSSLAKAAAETGAAFVSARMPALMKTDNPQVQLLYFQALADRSPVPVIVYDDPTALGASAPIWQEVSLHPNIAAVITNEKPSLRDGVAWLGSDSRKLYSALQNGAAGAVCPFANCAPYTLITIWEAFRTREHDAAEDWQKRIHAACQLVEGCYGIAALKAAMDVNNFYGGSPRLPRVPASAAVREEVARAIEGLKG